MANETAQGKRIDEATGTETVGHEWDGIEELNTPLPRWWVWLFYATIVFAIGYTVAYPAWPMIDKATAGVLGWSSHGQLAEEMAEDRQRRAPIMEALALTPIERLPENSDLMRAAVAGGRAAFKVNCVQCHGAGAAGSRHYPNLNDDDWLWGGDLKAIEYTITNGIRQPEHGGTRFSLMPAFGRDGLLTSAQINAVADHVLSLSGKAKDNPQGAQIFADNCAICHGPEGTGLREFGAPNLADALWLHGDSREDVIAMITNPRQGVMPAWEGRLDPPTIKMLAAYVHSLGGGEDFVEIGADPAVEVDETP
ncbi:cytochrome-c oxidase, cbb3-type subunit III [Altericroceibacterium spongiae]|uniref:Cbb3-type cytochrome c oxidase subunit n=1 Tax=Altericroceibacterium spongiae TaxID=2320269 RepID=A0A420EM72_9SPHN|nr:cytochrome-c oxidase, cbb3-type subunit III [Altericroceibacterium spongiae]RKF21716.1 cytochrome-c oxidase, cbb3-type subunit III [Altericroceibacterium spongiae]